MSQLAALENHIAERLAADRGLPLEDALAIVKTSLQKAGPAGQANRGARSLIAKRAKPPKAAKPANSPLPNKPKNSAPPKPAKKKLTARQRIARRFGPHYDKDDLRRCWHTVQGGAPGLGRRS